MRTATLLALTCLTFCGGCNKHRAEQESATESSRPVHDWVTVKDVRVRLDRVTLGRVPMIRKNRKGETEQIQSDKPYLAVYFTVENLSEDRIIDRLFRSEPNVKLSDETGYEYRDVNLWDMDKTTLAVVRPLGRQNRESAFTRRSHSLM